MLVPVLLSLGVLYALAKHGSRASSMGAMEAPLVNRFHEQHTTPEKNRFREHGRRPERIFEVPVSVPFFVPLPVMHTTPFQGRCVIPSGCPFQSMMGVTSLIPAGAIVEILGAAGDPHLGSGYLRIRYQGTEGLVSAFAIVRYP